KRRARGRLSSAATLNDNSVLPWPKARRGRAGDMMMVRLDRRQVLGVSAGALATAALGATISPAAAANDSADLIKKFTGGKTPAEGKVKLDLPEIAENGNTVPLTVLVESPMTEQSYVSDVLIVADGNPNAGVATFHFSPA